MTRLTRRRVLACVPFSTVVFVPAFVGLSDCTPAQATTDAQVLADASGAVASLNAVVQQFSAIDPKCLDPNTLAGIQNGLKIAQGLIANLSTATPAPTGASTLAQVDTYLNDGLTAIASVLPVASAAFPALAVAVPIVDAIIALLPGIEAWVNPILASTQAAPVAAARAPLAPIKAVVLVADARKALGIPKMK